MGERKMNEWKKNVLLGQGTSGKVYLVFNKTDGECAAMKEMENTPLAQSELRIQQKLSHRNICKVASSWVSDNDNNLNIVMPYFSGNMLENLRRAQRFSEDKARRYMKQILSAVRYMHRHGYVHKDIKLENVMLDEQKKKAFLIDFGFSRKYSRSGNPKVDFIFFFSIDYFFFYIFFDFIFLF